MEIYMNIIVVGGGKVGSEIVAALCPEGHNISVIDRDPAVIDSLTSEFDILGVCGSGVTMNTLEQAGIYESDLLIATTNMDEINILSCVIARRMGTKGTIARVRDPEINSQVWFMRESLGVSMMVNPEYNTAREISRMLRIPSAAHVESFAKGRIDMVEVIVPEGSPLTGVALKDLDTGVGGSRVLVCAVQRNGEDKAVIPGGDFIISEGDRVYISASHGQISNFFKQIGIVKTKVKNVMIIGGGRIAYYLSQMLIDSGMDVKIIEKDHDRCNVLAQKLPKVRIICGDGSNQELLHEEGLDKADALIALTDIDEDNIIMSMYAQMKECPKVILKVNSPNLRRMAMSAGLDSSVSPKELTADIILSYVRALEETTGGVIRSMYKLVDGQIEAMEFWATEGKVIGVPLSKLHLKKGLLIAGIFRDGRIIFPCGSDSIHPEDVVIVVTTNRFITSLDQILE